MLASQVHVLLKRLNIDHTKIKERHTIAQGDETETINETPNKHGYLGDECRSVCKKIHALSFHRL